MRALVRYPSRRSAGSGCAPALGALAAPPAAASGSCDVPATAPRGSARFKPARAKLAADGDRIVADTAELTEIQGPPFKGARQGAVVKEMLAAEALTAVTTDAEGGVFGAMRGSGSGSVASGAVFAVATHLATVFPAWARRRSRPARAWRRTALIRSTNISCSTGRGMSATRTLGPAAVRLIAGAK